MKTFLAGISGLERRWTLPELSVACLALVGLSNSAAALSHGYNLKLVWGLEVELSSRLLASYLAMPYPAFVRERLAQLSKNVLSTQLADRVLLPLSVAISKSALVVTIVGTLLLVDPGVALTVSVVNGRGRQGRPKPAFQAVLEASGVR